MTRVLLICSVILCLVLSSLGDDHHKAIKRTMSINPTPRQSAGEFTSDHWRDQAQATLKSKLNYKPRTENPTRPKNVILFIGDGMNLQTSNSARVHAGGDENFNLSFDKFPHFGLSKTYCVNRQVSDSANTATAFLSGVKTNYGLVGLDARAQRYNCQDHANKDYRTKSIGEWAMEAGKSVGFVTTTRVTHASPSPLYAHSANRYWESDADMKEDCDPSQFEDIAEQLVFGETGKKLKVVLGGGRNRFIPNKMVDEEGELGMREDGKNLIESWKEVHKNMGSSEYVWNREQLMNVDSTKTDYLLGLFNSDYIKYDYQAKEDPLEPSLSDMTEMAIKMLQKEEEGFFLYIEGGRIDTAHHDSFAKAALDETRALSEAIELAQRMTNSHDTLIVVSADHGHTLTYNGYPERKNDIFGVAEISLHDKLPYTTLSYINGAGVNNMYGEKYGERVDVTEHKLGEYDFKYYGHVPLNVASHSGDDVGVYATGPMSHLFEGAYEQNAIPYLMAYAAQIGPYRGAAMQVSLAGGILALIAMVHWFYNRFVLG